MSGNSKNSPLYKISKTLKLLRWIGGFPIQPSDLSFSQFRFIPWLELTRITILILMLVMEYIYWILVVLVYDGHLNNFFAFYEESYSKFSTSRIDQFSTVFLYITAIFFNVMLFLVFKCNALSISQLCKDTQKLESKLAALIIKKEETRKHLRYCQKMEKYTRTIVYGQFLNVVSSILWGIWAAEFLEVHYANRMEFYGNCTRLFYPILLAIQTSIIFFGPLVCSAEIVAGQIVNNLTDLFGLWEELLKCGSNDLMKDKDNKPHLNISGSLILDLQPDKTLHKSASSSDESKCEVGKSEVMFDIGLHLEKLIVTTNIATQGLIATIFSYHIVSLVFICYHIVSSLGLNNALSGKLKILQIIGGSFAASMYLVRFYSLMNSGQQLSIKVKQTRRAFENNIILKEPNVATDESRQKSYILQRRLEIYQYVSPISPYAVFGLNNKTFCATLATIISYIVILIKLRGVESPKSATSLQSANATISS